MVTKIYNSNLIKEIIDTTKLQTGVDSIPSETSEKVVLVANVNPKHARVCNIVRASFAAAGGVTIYVTPADKDFYLISATISQSKVVANSQTNATLTVVPYGQTAALPIVGIAGTTLTEESSSNSISLVYPLLLAKDSNVAIVKVAGNGNAFASIVGYTIDNINA